MTASEPTKLRVLIADSDATRRYLYSSFLEGSSFEIQEAEHAEGVLRRCGESLPDCILLGEDLPELGPVATVRRLRDSHGRASVAVVHVGTTSDVYQVLRAMRDGVDEYVTAGELTPAQLERAIRQAFDGVSVRRALQAESSALSASVLELEALRGRLQAATESRRQVCIRVADDIRTPLGVIANAMETLEQDGVDAETLRALLPMVRRAITRLDLVAQTFADAASE